MRRRRYRGGMRDGRYRRRRSYRRRGWMNE